jgi:hypothetical protein
MRGRKGVWDAGPRGLAIALALVLLTALAGCGGGSGKPTKAQYIQRANAVCANEKQAMKTIALSHGSLVAAVDRSNVAREEANVKLAALASPSRGAISPEWLSARREALKAAKAFSAAKAGSAAYRAAGSAYFLASQHAASIAKSYGLAQCGGFAAS